MGCGEKTTSQDNAVTDDTDIAKVENPKADEWYVKSIEEYNRQATKEVLVYDVVNGEEMKEEAITYIVDKDEKTAKIDVYKRQSLYWQYRPHSQEELHGR